MNFLIGDIGNTKIKVCLVDDKNYKIKKLIYFDSKKIYSKKFLRKNFKKVITNNICKTALFSCVVPKYKLFLSKFIN